MLIIVSQFNHSKFQIKLKYTTYFIETVFHVIHFTGQFKAHFLTFITKISNISIKLIVSRIQNLTTQNVKLIQKLRHILYTREFPNSVSYQV